VEEGDASVVPVRFQLRPKERPKGGEGQKLRRLTCGVFAGEPGQVVIPGDFFPDIDEGSDALEPFDFQLVLPGGEEVPAQPVGVDRVLNLAFLQADPRQVSSFRPAAFDPDVEAAVGDEVVMIGLMPEKYNFARVVYNARVNAVISQPRRMYSLDTPVEDLAIGGLVLLKDGRPLGILGEDLVLEERVQGNTANILSLLGSANQGPKPGYPMVFPLPTFSASLAHPPKLSEERLENRGWMGITMQPLSKDLGEYWNIRGHGGVIVAGVIDGSPASLAGLRPGDVILEVDGHEVAVREQGDLVLMQRMIRTAGAGRDIPMSVWREGDTKVLQVRLAPSPMTATLAQEHEDETFGMKVRELTYDYLQMANLDRSTKGVVVVGLERAGWAQVSGLQPRDIIQKVAGEPTPDLESFKAMLAKLEKSHPREVMFFVLRDYQTQFFRVKADWSTPHP
jgi:serine protease Do